MMTAVFRLLLLGVLLAGALLSGAAAGQAHPLNPPPQPDRPTPTPGPPLPTPLATPLAIPPVREVTDWPAPCQRTSDNNAQQFPATGFTVSGDFANYWTRNGGLPDQGYPISTVITEVSDLDHTPYQVQYFERAVFECHPANIGTEYAVLLAQLGTIQYHQLYPQGAPNQRPNGERALFFSETGHTLGGEFRTYWEQHGGKYQQGLPLSDEFTEVSPLDGKPYTVQYFERAVFEYHPENQPPYRVLLSQLGTLRYRARYPTPPPPVALPPPDPTGPRFLGYQLQGNQYCTLGFNNQVVAAGSTIFWPDANSSYTTPTLLGFDAVAGRQLSGGQPWQLASTRTLASDGRTLVWRDFIPNDALYLHSTDLATGREILPWRITSATLLAAVGAGDTLYSLTYATYDSPRILSAYNGATGQTSVIATAPANREFTNLMAGGGYVAWVALARQTGDPQLYVAPVAHPAAATLVTTEEVLSPVISGDHLFWLHPLRQANGSYDPLTGMEVRMYTFSTRTTQVLDRGRATQLSASGDRVAWRLAVPGYWGDQTTDYVGVLDLRTGQKHTYRLPPDVTDCVALVGPALAYVRYTLASEVPGASLPELYLQPLP